MTSFNIQVPQTHLWNVVSAAARVDHGAHHLNIHQVREITWFLQVVHPARLHHLPRDLIGHLNEMTSWADCGHGATCLVAPFVDDGHVDVVHEDRHFLARRWPVRRAHSLVHVRLNGSLQTRTFITVFPVFNWGT